MKLYYTLFLLLFSMQLTMCQTQKSIERLDNTINSIHKKTNFPGFAIAILQNDSVVFSKGYGFADLAKKIPYTVETTQPIASVSKTFVALSVLKAIELGYFTLETNINDLLPFKIVNPNFPNGIITVKQLTTHTSSLIDNDTIRFKTYSLGNTPTMDLGSFCKAYYTPTGQYYTLQNFGTQPIGTNYAYSNIATGLMAYIIEYKAKMSFKAFTNKYIFEPLKMKNTAWFTNEKMKDKAATLYQITVPEHPIYYKLINPDNSIKPYTFVTYPDGSLQSSVNDLILYTKCMVNGFSGKSFQLINKESYNTLFKKQFADNAMPTNMDAKEPNRAIYWSHTKKGEIRHTGSSPGVFSFISFNPITKVAKIMLMNACLEGDENVKQVEALQKITEAIKTFENTLK